MTASQNEYSGSQKGSLTQNEKSEIVFCIIGVSMIFLIVFLLSFAYVGGEHQSRMDAYDFCMETEMGQGHGDKYGNPPVWQGPNLMERYRRAVGYCNGWYYRVYGVEIDEDPFGLGTGVFR